MQQKKQAILQLLNRHRLMALATNRADGWPQVTLVGYVNDGFLLYCFVAVNSQKHANILRDSRVSAAIGSDAPHPLDIQGLSLAGKASVVTDQGEFNDVSRLRLKRYPEFTIPRPVVSREAAAARAAARPSLTDVVLRYDTSGWGASALRSFTGELISPLALAAIVPDLQTESIALIEALLLRLKLRLLPFGAYPTRTMCAMNTITAARSQFVCLPPP